MKNLSKFIGVTALTAVIVFLMAGCPEAETSTTTTTTAHEHEWTDWTPFIYPNAVLGGWEKRYCKLDSSHAQQRRVERPSDATVVPESFSDEKRWTKEIDIPVTATLEFEVDSSDVCKVTVSNATSTTRWLANVHYYYTAQKNKAYEYKFEAWTVGPDRTLSVQCYYDFDTQESVMANDITINSTRQTYTIYGGTIPDNGIRSLQFLCANQTGTFSVKIISITPYTLDQLPAESRWTKNVDPGSTVELEYEVDSDEVCTITLTGTAMNNSNGDWNAWRARANYLFESQANTHYTFVFEAWMEGNKSSHWLDMQYYYDEADQLYYDIGVEISQNRQTYVVKTDVQRPIIKGGIRELRFQVADYTGIINIKIISITPYTPIPPEATGELTINNFPLADTGAWFGGYAYNYYESGWDYENNEPVGPIDPTDPAYIRLNFEYSWDGKTGNTITFAVYKDGAYGNEAFTGELIVPVNNLTIDSWGDNTHPTQITNAFYKNTQPITFTNGNVTIDFNTQMKADIIVEWVKSRQLTITGIDQDLINLIMINGADVWGWTDNFGNNNDQDLYFIEPELSGTTATFKVEYRRWNNYETSLPSPLYVSANELSIYVVDTEDHYTVYKNTQTVTFTNGIATVDFANMQYSHEGDWGSGDVGGGDDGDGDTGGGGGTVGPGTGG